MSRFLIERFRALTEYVPGGQPQDRKYVKLNTNESAYPPSPRVIESVNAESMQALRLYSDPQSTRLKAALAEAYGTSPDMVFVSNGSDEALGFFFAAFCGEGTPVCCPAISYGFYPVFAQFYGVEYRPIPMEPDLSVDPRRFCEAKGNIVIANPNAPTGIALSVQDVETILKSDPDRLVCVDEAYVDFGAETVLPLLSSYENLVVVRTYSKSRSMAGARLGFAFASPEVTADLEKIKYSTNPYNVNRLTQAAGEAALLDSGYYADCCKKIAADREFTAAELGKLGGEMTDSVANFIFVRFPGYEGGRLYRELKSRGILVRHFSDPRISDYLRITVGTREECETLINALADILGGKR